MASHEGKHSAGKHAGNPAPARSGSAPAPAEEPARAGRLRILEDRPILSIIVKTLLILLGVILAGMLFIRIAWLGDLPDCSDAQSFNYNQPTEVYAADGATLLARFQLENCTPLSSLDRISPYVTVGTVATEDERFYYHAGVDLASIARAIGNNLTGGTLEGASTITQQLVRNTVLADERGNITLKRKVREAYLALKMERVFSKDEILLMYLNTINYGSGAYGIEAAAQRYFTKSAASLTLTEAALLVAIPQSPTYNDPNYYPDHALERRNLVLDRMASYGAITQEMADEAKAEPIILNMYDRTNDGIIMFPYFSSYVRERLMNAYDLSTKTLFQGGLKVYTTLDVTAQETAEIVAAERERQAGDDFEAALVALDPDNGYIRAMVGGRSYYTDQYNLATQGARQTGSSFKTFTLIASMEQGISPETMVNCGPSVTIGDWHVSNIDGRDYGVRSIARAFAVSSNTGFARLIAATGPEHVAETANRMGISSELPADASITLGVVDVTPLDMAASYASIATGGIYHEPVCVQKVLDARDKVLVDNSTVEGQRVISEEVACAAIDVMRLVIESSEGTGTEAHLECGQDAVGKTGTTESYRDSWFCGITPQYSVAIWLGDRSNEHSLKPSVTAAPAFSDLLDVLLADAPLESFPTAPRPDYSRIFSNSNLDLNLS